MKYIIVVTLLLIGCSSDWNTSDIGFDPQLGEINGK